MKQEPPFSLEIELTRGCNLRCDFCGIKAIHTKKIEFLSIEMAERISEMLYQSGWNPRICFHGRGEPTLNPDHLQILKMFRKRFPKHYIDLLSNGGNLKKEGRRAIQEIGINYFGLEMYAGREDRMREITEGLRVFEFDGSDHDLSPYNRRKDSITVLISNLTHNPKKIHNTGGHSGPLDYSKINIRCARPFRELQIRFDGTVSPCCIDWTNEYDICNIEEYGSLEECWNHTRFEILRKHLYHKMRIARPCYGCNCVTYRLGFLPDKLGKETMPYPTEEETKLWKGEK